MANILMALGKFRIIIIYLSQRLELQKEIRNDQVFLFTANPIVYCWFEVFTIVTKDK